MSYILDALRRAEAERGRGSVPGLHSQAVPAGHLPPAKNPGVAARSWGWLVAAAVGAAVLAAGGTWWALQRPASLSAGAGTAVSGAALGGLETAPRPHASSAPPAVAGRPAEAGAGAGGAPPRPVQRALPHSPTAGSAAPPVREVAAPPVQPPAATAAAVVEREAATLQGHSVQARVPAGASTPSPARQPAPEASAAGLPPQPEPAPLEAPAPARAAVLALADLPAVVRAQLPALQLAGVSYSKNPSYRMAIVNGQVLHEGDSAAPGLVLQAIEPARTVWTFQGYRYALPSR